MHIKIFFCHFFLVQSMTKREYNARWCLMWGHKLNTYVFLASLGCFIVIWKRKFLVAFLLCRCQRNENKSFSVSRSGVERNKWLIWCGMCKKIWIFCRGFWVEWNFKIFHFLKRNFSGSLQVLMIFFLISGTKSFKKIKFKQKFENFIKKSKITAKSP